MKDDFDGWSDTPEVKAVEEVETPTSPTEPEEVDKKNIVNEIEDSVKVESIDDEEDQTSSLSHSELKVDTTKLARRPPMGDNVKTLLYGTAGTGKTRAAMLQFKKLWEKNKKARCKIFDTDKGLTETLKELDNDGKKLFPKEFIDNMDWYNCKDFKATLAAMKEVFQDTTKDDMIVFDMLDKLFEDAQEHYSIEIFGEDLSNFYMRRRVEMDKDKSKNASVFDGWKDWVPIKMLHNREIIDRITKQIGCHVVCITSAKVVEQHDLKKGKIIENPTIFTNIGFAPVGEKRNDHRFDRIYYFSIGVKDWYYVAVKKRGGDIYTKIPIMKGDCPDL